MRIALCIGATFVVMNLATFVAYGSLSALVGLEPPAVDSPGRFFVSVLVVKLGLATAFVLLYHVAQDIWFSRWIIYAAIWWIAFATMEIGQAIAPDYSWMDALGGIIAEAVYFPMSALVTRRMLGQRKGVDSN